MTNIKYTAQYIKECIDNKREELFANYAAGRPINWKTDISTNDLICIGNWLEIELRKINTSEEDRKTQLWKYNREGRSSLDLFQCAADIMNETISGNVEKNRVPHRRWG